MSFILSILSGRRTDVLDPFSWDPCENLLDNLRDNLRSSAREASAIGNASVDWKETPEAHAFKADLPGLKKEEVKVEVEEDGRILQISGERGKEQEEKSDKWQCIERSSGKFLRRFSLPVNTKMDQFLATMENGVLTVTLLKEEVKKRQVRSN